MFINRKILAISIAVVLLLAVATARTTSGATSGIIVDPSTLSELQPQLQHLNNLVLKDYIEWADGYDTLRTEDPRYQFVDWSHDNCSTPFNINVPFGYKQKFRYACLKHDMMWRTLAVMDGATGRVWNERNRSAADTRFKKDTWDYCEYVEFADTHNPVKRDACRTASDGFYRAVHQWSGFRKDDTRPTEETNSLTFSHRDYVRGMKLMPAQECNFVLNPANRCLPINYIEHNGKPFIPQNIPNFPTGVNMAMIAIRANQYSVKGPPSDTIPLSPIPGNDVMNTSEMRLVAKSPFIIGTTEQLDCGDQSAHRFVYLDSYSYPAFTDGDRTNDADLKATPIVVKACASTSDAQEDTAQLELFTMKGRREIDRSYTTLPAFFRSRHYQHINATVPQAHMAPDPATVTITHTGQWYGPITVSTILPLTHLHVVENPHDDTPLVETSLSRSGNHCRNGTYGGETNGTLNVRAGSTFFVTLCHDGEGILEIRHPTGGYVLNRYKVQRNLPDVVRPVTPVIPITPTNNCDPESLPHGNHTLPRTWNTGDCRSVFRTGSYVDYFSFIPETTGRFNIHLTSYHDTWLLLYQNQVVRGIPFANNDDLDGDSNSWLSLILTEGTTYIIGATTWASNRTGDYTLQITMPQVTALAVPSVTATPGDSLLTLSWNTVTDATGYQIQKRGTDDDEWTTLNSQGYTIDSTGLTATAVITGLTNGLTYQHQVRATSSSSESAWSTPITRTRLAIPSIDQPTVTSAPSDGTATLSWPAVTGATLYDIQQRASDTANWALLTNQTYTTTDNTVTAAITSLTNGTEYQHQVRARNSSSLSSWSTPITRTTPQVILPLTAPQIAASGGNATVTLRWYTVTDATGYDIEQRDSDTADWTPLPTQSYTIGGNRVTAVVTGLTNGVEYQYQVKAKAPPRFSPWSRPVARATPWVTLTRPTNFGYTGGDRIVTLRWNAVTHALEYEVQQWVGTVNPGEWRTLPFTEYPYPLPFTIAFSGTSATVGNLMPDSGYAHRIRAVNGKVISPWAPSEGWITTQTNATSGPRDAEDDSSIAPDKPKPTPTPNPDGS